MCEIHVMVSVGVRNDNVEIIEVLYAIKCYIAFHSVQCELEKKINIIKWLP